MKMAQKNTMKPEDADYLPQLQAEKDSLDPSFQHASKLLDKEIDRVKSGRHEDKNYLDAVAMNPVKVSVKVLIPVKAHPKFNFVGKLLGPGGATMKKLQAETGCRMAIMGKGSMKDKKKEEDLRKEGGKHAHLNDVLHVNIEALAPALEVYDKISCAVKHIQPYLIPVDGDMNAPPPHELGYENGDNRRMSSSVMDSRAAPPALERGRPAAYRDDPYYDAAPPAPVPRAPYDEYRERDPYERPPARGEYDRAPAPLRGAPPRAAAAPPTARGPPARGAPAPRENLYEYGHSGGAVAPGRYEDPYESRGASAGSWGGQQSYKAPAAGRSRAPVDRPHPYPSGGRGAARY